MDSREFFQDVAARNYHEFFGRPDDIRLLWNAVVSMNSVAEYLALDQLGYPEISRKDLGLAAQKIREQYALLDLKFCADTFKHVRGCSAESLLETRSDSITKVTAAGRASAFQGRIPWPNRLRLPMASIPPWSRPASRSCRRRIGCRPSPSWATASSAGRSGRSDSLRAFVFFSVR
jgi:hypothetical protein